MANMIRIFLLIVLSMMLTSCQHRNDNDLASNGHFTWTDDKQVVFLNGEWSFYKDQLLSPSEIKQTKRKKTMSVPGYWEEARGFGTYELTLHLPEEKIGKVLAISIPKIFSSFNLWIDGKLYWESGVVATETKRAVPSGIPVSTYFVPKSKTLNIVLQVSNYDYRHTGISGPILLGEALDIALKQKRELILRWFSIGSLFIIGLLQINFYVNRRKEPVALFFGLFCLSLTARGFLNGQMEIHYFFPNIDWALITKFQFLIIFLSLILFTQYIALLYPKEINKRITKSIHVISIACITIILITKPIIFSYLFLLFEGLIFFVILYFSYVMGLAIVRKRDGAIIISISFITLATTVILDVLYNMQIINIFAETTIFGFVVLCTAQSYVISKKFADTLYQKESLMNEVEKSQREVILTLGEIIENRSKETGNHVRRVAEYSYLLARKYGLSCEQASLIKNASPMHDIGKVAIPDYILNKPGRLTPEEFEIVKTHTEIGYKMLQHSDRELIKLAAIIAHTHHEKFNGSGYPQGLKGTEIPIEGRITTLADVFDALINPRVYKDPWSLEDVVELINTERGQHFDPGLVDVFMDNIEQFVNINNKFKDR
jgi:hypothetical protein